MYKYLSEEPRSRNRAAGESGGVANNNNHDSYSRQHHRRRQQQQQQIERIKREIQIRAVISDDFDPDIEDDDEVDGDDEEEENKDIVVAGGFENDSAEVAIEERKEPVPGNRCQGRVI